MSPWWEKFPGRLDWELEDFTARDLDFQLDEELIRDAGRVLLRGTLHWEDQDIELEVLFPDLFPYMRPEVFAPNLSLRRHQNPVLKNLCLLERNTKAWDSYRTAAWLVAERVPELLSLFEAGPEAMRAGEVAQGEPVSSYFGGLTGTAIFVPASALETDPALKVGSGRLWFAPEAPPQIRLRALLGELVTKTPSRKTKMVARADEMLGRRFGGDQLQMRWVRLAGAPSDFTADAILSSAGKIQPGFDRPPWQKVRDGDVAVLGAIFPEEVDQGIEDDAWVFAVKWRRKSGGITQEGSYVIRGERLTDQDLGARIPHLAALREAVVSQVGLGAIGAPVALELIRNQVGEIRAIEYDQVEASQIVRWPLGLEAVGFPKLAAIEAFSRSNFPYSHFKSFQHLLGQTALERRGRSENEVDLVHRFLDGANLVLDASAEYGVNHVISDLASERQIMQVYSSATEGARGGQVALIVPGAGGCWYCWKKYVDEDRMPVPPAEKGATVQPRGCASPTFTGAGFDLLPIIAQTVRVAAAAIASPGEQSSRLWVCAIPEDPSAAPIWDEHPLEPHLDCPACGGRT